MKFWNKQPEYRKSWTCVKLPVEERSKFLAGDFKGWMQRRPYEDLKRNLQNDKSDGKFYMMILKKEIWFERAEDATMFALRYM